MTGTGLLNNSNLNNSSESTDSHSQTMTLTDGQTHLDLPDASFIRDADFQRDGVDLVLDGSKGTITIEGYFSAEQPPTLTGPDGGSLSPQLVQSFVHNPAQFAQVASMNDESPIGEVSGVTGDATITRLSGQIEPIAHGTPVYQGDIVETANDGALNIVFSDESSFAVSEDSRLAIDEYVYDAENTGEGAQSFSVLKGVFVFTSGLVGRDDPDDVTIDTPSGSIGIRGTIIAGDVNQGEITVVEGAIVLRDTFGNEVTLDNQFETAKFMSSDEGIKNMGEMTASDVAAKFASVSEVAPGMFSSINDAAKEARPSKGQDTDGEAASEGSDEQPQEQSDEQEDIAPEVDGSIDQDGDNEVDGTVADIDGQTGTKGTMVESMMQAEQGHESQVAGMDANNAGSSRKGPGSKNGHASRNRAEGNQDDAVQSDVEVATDLPVLPPIDEPLVESGPQINFIAESASSTLAGNEANNVLSDNGLADVNLLGAGGNDTFQISTGIASYGFLDGGNGFDTLEVTGSGVLDFGNVGAIQSIEVIDLGIGNGSQDIKMTYNDVISSVGTAVLRIDGDSNDSLEITDLTSGFGGYTATGNSSTVDGEMYIEYGHNSPNGQILLIDADIAVTGAIT